MIDCANLARKSCKVISGYTLCKFTEEMRLQQIANGEITATMRDAIIHNEFIIYYQPKIDLNTLKMVGAEALVRWIHHEKIMPPNDFIPLFEKNGFIEKLDYYVLESVCRFINACENVNVLPRISVNLSGITLMGEDLIENYCRILGEYQVKTSYSM